MKSLRLRVFLITWPLVVLAVGSVAWVFDRWAEVELRELEIGPPDELPMARSRWDSAVVRLPSPPWSDAIGMAEALRALAADSVDLVLLGPDGALVASTDARIRPRDGRVGLRGPEPVAFVAAREVAPGAVHERVVAVGGHAVPATDGSVAGRLYVLPRGPEAARVDRDANLRAEARRTILVALVASSGVAAALALLLAGPIVHQVGRLAGAAARVRAGDLRVRVPVGSRDEVGGLERAFNEMTAALEAAERHKRNLVTDVAHELRTPLTNIVGTIEAIEDGLRTPDARTLATLGAEVRLLTSLVDELQELSLAESGQLPLDIVVVDARAAARAAVEAMRESAGSVVLEPTPPGEPVYVRADERRLAQVLRNLLHNALTHTPPGRRVHVEIRPPSEATGGRVGILVHDEGRGIPAEHLPLIWERLHRVDAARDRSSGGHGLGLAIVRHLVELMCGAVAVTSTVGHGSTFEVWLPSP